MPLSNAILADSPLPDNSILSFRPPQDDKNLITYRRAFVDLTDNPLAALLLQQVLYFWALKGGKPFYKFKEPCNHKLYTPDDSWCETMSWSRYQFDHALSVFATKLTQGVKRKELEQIDLPQRHDDENLNNYGKRFAEALKCCVFYWIDRQRVTWYEINTPLLEKFIERIYLSKAEGLRYILNPKLSASYLKLESDDREETQQTRFTSTESLSETSTETSTEKQTTTPAPDVVVFSTQPTSSKKSLDFKTESPDQRPDEAENEGVDELMDTHDPQPTPYSPNPVPAHPSPRQAWKEFFTGCSDSELVTLEAKYGVKHVEAWIDKARCMNLTNPPGYVRSKLGTDIPAQFKYPDGLMANDPKRYTQGKYADFIES